jgi:hypothetical protein
MVSWLSYPSSVSSFSSALDLTTQTKVGYFANKLRVDQNIAGSQVSVHVVHLGQVLHSSCNASQHTCQLQNLELTVVCLEFRQ